MSELAAAGKPIAGVELLDTLRASKQLETIGGAAYLFEIAEGAVPTPSYLTSRARIVKEKARRRQLIEMCATAAGRASDRSLSLNVALDSIQDGLLEIAGNQADQPVQAVTQISDRVFAEIAQARNRPKDEMVGLPTGFGEIDWDMGGICPGELWVIGGRPGEGKSSLATQIAVTSCQAGVPVLFFTIEMTENQLLRRVWCQVSGVAPKHWKDPRLMNAEEWAKAQKTMGEVAQWPLFLDWTHTVWRLTAKAARGE